MSANQLEIASLAVALGAVEVGGPLSEDEQHLVDKSAHLAAPTSRAVRKMREQIRAGQDPLGDLFYEHRDAATRRGDGAVYTPEQLIEPMVKWALEQSPARIVDAGCGSGRFVAAIARRDSGMHLVAVDLDPLATLMTRAVLAVLGVKAARVLHADYTVVSTDELDGVTAFVGNPPYVRHHQLPVRTKEWGSVHGSATRPQNQRISWSACAFFPCHSVLRTSGRYWLLCHIGGVARCQLRINHARALT